MTQPALQPIPRDALKALVKGLSGLQTIWESEKAPYIGGGATGPNAYAELSLTSYAAIGVDDYRQVWDPVAGALQSQMYGNRNFTLGVLVRSFALSVLAADIAERVRWRLRTTSAKAVYNAAGLALGPISALRIFTDVPNKGDDHITTWCASFDVIFAMAVCADPLDDAGSIIETVDSATGGIIPIDLE